MKTSFGLIICSFFLSSIGWGAAPDTLPNTTSLTEDADFSAGMVRGIHRYLDRATADSIQQRSRHWNRDFSSASAYEESVKTNLVRLRTMIGVVDDRVAPHLDYVASPNPTLPANPRTRQIKATDRWTMYEVLLDVWPDVFTWGYLIVPHGIKAGERRPVVVCQHGLEGLPESVVTEDPSDRASGVYNAFAIRLAERGFVTYAPHNPYRGETEFRQLQRKANPLGLTLYSFILGQHQQTLSWLKTLPFVDAKRIGFYGLSYV